MQGRGSRARADVSPVSMLEVLAHLAQGDIPLLSAARTRRRVSPQPGGGVSWNGALIQIIDQSCENNAPLKGSLSGVGALSPLLDVSAEQWRAKTC